MKLKINNLPHSKGMRLIMFLIQNISNIRIQKELTRVF